MSMLDGLFNKGFRGSKCKTLLKLAIPRIKLLRNRRELQIKQMRKDIAKLLETGQEATARIRVEHIKREENMMAAQEIIELFCELIAVRLPIIENQRECPLDLKEAISSICFAAPRCADLPELLQVQLSFASKYGREFIVAATELMPDCGVNRQLIELLSVRAPSADKKLKLLKEIAEEHGLDWDPASSETELFKSHEDLLDGSRQFVSGSKVPLPEEKHEEVIHSASTKAAVEQSDSDSGLDSLDFPEVPTAALRPTAESVSAKKETPFPSAPHPEPGQRPASDYENATRQPSKGSEDENIAWAGRHDLPGPPKAKQYVPFTYPPPMLSQSVSFKEAASPPPEESPTRITSDPSPQSLPRVQNERAEPSPQPLPAKPETKLNLQDVLVAAKAAADSADRAAAAARSAASLAHLRISELSEISSNRFGQSSDVLPDNPFGMDNPNPSEKLQLDRQVSSAGSDASANSAHTISNHSQTEPTESLFKTASFGEAQEQASPQQLPKRMPSAEDDLLGSYPNLFGSGGHSFTEPPHSRN